MPRPLFFCFFVFFYWVLFSGCVKLPGLLFFFFFFSFDGFCFLCQLNCPDLCFFFFLMGFVFCDSYYSTGALCTKFTLVTKKIGWSIMLWDGASSHASTCHAK
jgi:hypothetical protein